MNKREKITPETQYIEKLSGLFLQAELINKEIRLISEMVMRSCKITDMNKALSINRETMEFFVFDKKELENKIQDETAEPPIQENTKQK